MKNSLLWKVTHEAWPAPCYLFGTMHVKDAIAFTHWEKAQARLSEVASFAIEYDLKENQGHEIQAQMRLPDNQKLNDFLSPRLQVRLERVVQRELHLPLSYFQSFKPIFLMNMLTINQFESQGAHGLDEALYLEAQRLDIPTTGLETFDRQLEVLENMTMKKQLKDLKEIATHLGRYKRFWKRTAQYYMEENIHKVYKVSQKSLGSMRKLMLYQRNKDMAERFAELATTQSLFAAVGAAHLAGAKGMLRVLKHKGAKLEAL